MSAKTAIKWTDHTFNIVWGCTKKLVHDESPETWLATVGEEELRALVARVPQAVLRKLRD